MTQVFISYSRKDLRFVQRLEKDLKKAGLEVWYDMSGISGGSHWRTEIERAMKNSQFVIVVLSPDSLASEWVEREFLYANKLNLKLIPLMYRTCDLTLNYLNLNYIDVRGASYQQNFEKLLDALKIDPNHVPRSALPRKSVDVLKSQPLLSIMAVIVLSVGGLFLLQFTGKALSPDPTSTPEAREIFPTVTASVTAPPPTLTATLTKPPTLTLTSEPGFTIVDPVEVLNIAPQLRTFGQLAIEKYSVEERNKINNTLAFTVNSTTDTSILWRWFWCAVNDRILEQNMTKISILFDADGYVIPEEQLATVVFENPDPTYEGWKCRTYETVIRDWKPGTYTFTQTVTLATPINDGRDKFEAGYKIYEYTVNIAPK